MKLAGGGGAATPGVTRALADFIAESRFEDLPDVVRHEGRRALVNWIGSVFGGCMAPAVRTSLPLLDRMSGPREASVIGHGIRTDILAAAFLNSMSNASRSFNDTHWPTVAHPTASVAAALLALSERGSATGAEFLHALILGVEVQCRIGNILMTPPARCASALSMIGLVGGLGAAVASAKLMKLDAKRTGNAIGIAAAQSGGIRATHGSMAGRLISGEAARAGLMSALLAENGFTASEEVLEGAKGYARAFATWADPAVAVSGLGTEFEILRNTYKPYPCGIVIHPIIDVCLDLVRLHDLRAGEIDEVRLRVNETALALTGRTDPVDSNTAGTSLYHWAAAALLHRAAGLSEGADDCVLDREVIALRKRVSAVVDPEIRPVGARAEIRLKGGRVLHGVVEHARGSERRQLTDDELSEKFLGQAQLIIAQEAADDLLARSWRLIEAADVKAQLAPMLVAG